MPDADAHAQEKTLVDLQSGSSYDRLSEHNVSSFHGLQACSHAELHNCEPYHDHP